MDKDSGTNREHAPRGNSRERLFIRGGLLVAHHGAEARYADLVIRDGRIESVVDPSLDAPDRDHAMFDAGDCMLIPGLINAHTHSSGNLVRSLSAEWNLELQLNAGPAFRGEQTTREKYLTTLIGALEAVSRGCTACYDFFYEHPLPSPLGMRQVGKAYQDVGMRAVIAPMVSDTPFGLAVAGLYDVLPEEIRRNLDSRVPLSWKKIIQSIETLMNDWPFDWDQIRLGIAPTIPMHCSDDLLKGARDFARANGITLHTHLAESKVQAVSALDKYGTSITRHLHRLGILAENFTGAHGVWIDREDMRILSGEGASIAHNPGSNMRLGAGIAAIREMLDEGLQVALGTDSRFCSDNLNMFEAMRLASLCSRIHGYDHERWISPKDALSFATAGSARALGMASSLGRIEAGYEADIVFLDRGNTNYIPLVNAMNQIVHAEDATAVRHVMIHGNFVYLNRQFPRIDLHDVRREAQQATDRLLAANTPAIQDVRKLEPVIAAHCRTLAKRHLPINRHMDKNDFPE